MKKFYPIVLVFLTFSVIVFSNIKTSAQCTFLSQPSIAGQVVCPNASAAPLTVTFSCPVTQYEWYSNTTQSYSGATKIIGATSNSYTPSSPTFGTFYYYVVASKSDGSQFTSNISGGITFPQPVTSVTYQPSNANPTYCENGVPPFSVAITGGGPITYQWYKWSITSLPQSDPASWMIVSTSPSFTPGISGTYKVEAQSQGNCWSGGNTWNVTLTPLITGQPLAWQQVCPNVPLTPLSVTAPGATGYQWYNGFPSSSILINGATASSYTPPIPNSTTNYYVVVTGSGCSETSSPATVWVQQPTLRIDYSLPGPLPLPNPPSLVTCQNSSFPQLLVGGYAQGSMGLQWYSNTSNSNTGGTPINGATTFLYTPTVTPGTYYYYAEVSSCAGIAKSNVSLPVTIIPNPTVANAGPDQTGSSTCGLIQVTLAGNLPIDGTGAWSIVSGAGGTITTPSSPTSTFKGTAGSTYTLRWTISNNPCTPSSDDVVIKFNPNPTVADAGPDQTGSSTCGLIQVTLAGNWPTYGFGAWSIISGTGGTITTPSSPTSTFKGTAGSTYTLRWTISNNPCVQSTDDVVIKFNQNPTVANAGPDQTGSSTCGLTQVTLAGNSPTVGTGAWSIISGTGGNITTPSSPTSTFTGIAGSTYTLRWTIANGPCTSQDDVVITFNQNPTVANAGPDQTGSSTCGLTQVTLAGNSPTVGTGTWSIISGTGGTITTPSSRTSSFSGIAGSTYTLRWTISNGPCTSQDDVVITFNQNPTVANAGPDQTGSSTCGLTQVTLAGNSPTVGTGTWSIVSGTGGTITTPSSPTSTFSGTAGSSYTLRWTISNNPCTPSTDDVVITFNQNPTVANAGPDQTGSSTCGVTQVTLAGNSPTVGTGTWSIVSGTGGTITTPSSPTSTFSGTAGSSYTLRWTISNNPCTPSTDDVVIIFNPRPSSIITGTKSICPGTATQLSIALTGVGPWNLTYSDGTTPTNVSGITTSPYTFNVSPSSTTAYTVIALSDSRCTATSMTGSAVVTVISGYITTSSSTICGNTYYTFTAGPGTNYHWSTGATTSSIQVIAGSGPYSVTYITNGCTVSASTSVGIGEASADPSNKDDLNRQTSTERIECPAASSTVDVKDIPFTYYPNPAKGQITIVLSKTAKEDCPILWYSMSGQEVRSDIIESGNKQKTFPLNGIDAGLYLVRIKDNEKYRYSKIVVE